MKHGYAYYWQDGIQQQEDVLSSLMGLSETSGTLTRVSQSLGITKEQAKLIKICSHQYCAQIHSPIWPLLFVQFWVPLVYHHTGTFSISFNKFNISNYKRSGVIVHLTNKVLKNV